MKVTRRVSSLEVNGPTIFNNRMVQILALLHLGLQLFVSLGKLEFACNMYFVAYVKMDLETM